MIGEWTAPAVRARALASRRIGRERVRAVATSPTLAAALAVLADTPYGRDLTPGMTLAIAGRAVWSTLLWHLRILAGWSPAAGMNRVRLLAGGFEIANVVGYLAQLDGFSAAPPFELGRLETAWRNVRRVTTAAEVRRALARSGWGDPAGESPAIVAAALQSAWARRVSLEVPEARPWATAFESLLRARAQPADGNAPQWLDEASIWRAMEAQALAMGAGWRPGPSAIVATAGLLAADAWRTRAALEIAARGGAHDAEVLDAVA